MSHICLVCGYPDLTDGPTIGNDHSYEICSCCHFEFGVTDMDEGYSYAGWREKWIREGMQWWWRPEQEKPAGWDPRAQLRTIGVII